MSVRGSLHLADLKTDWPIERAQLDVDLSVAIADLEAWVPEAVTRTGTLQLQAHVEGSDESLIISDLRLDLDDTQPLRGKASGKLGFTIAQLEAMRTLSESSPEVWVPADLDLLADLATIDIQALSPLFGQPLPDLGALSAKGRLLRDGNVIRIIGLDARTTGKRPLHLTTEGQLALAGIVADQGMTEVDLRLTAQAPDAKSLASLSGPLPIEPGPWRLESQIKGETGALRAERIKFKAGTGDSVQPKVEGSISDLEHLIAGAGMTPSGVLLKGSVAATTTQQFGVFIGQALPDLGRLDANFDIQGDKAVWSILNASVAITHTTGFDLKATGQASDLLHDTRFDTRLELNVPDPRRAAAAMGGILPQLPAIAADGQFQGSQKLARFDGRLDVGTMPIKTTLEAEFSGPRPHLSGTLSTPALYLSEFLSPEERSNTSPDKPGISAGPTAEAQAERKLIFSDKPLGFEHLHHADIDLKFIADKIEGKRIRTERLELNIEVQNGLLKAHHRR